MMLKEADGGAVIAPHLSALRPPPNRPEWDAVVWISALTVPGTPAAGEFYQEMEQWLYAHFAGSNASVRSEWSKGWAYTADGPWTSSTVLQTTVPRAFRSEDGRDLWAEASKTLNRYDPHRIYTSPLLDALLPEPAVCPSRRSGARPRGRRWGRGWRLQVRRPFGACDRPDGDGEIAVSHGRRASSSAGLFGVAFE
jgi:hypothetical protein